MAGANKYWVASKISLSVIERQIEERYKAKCCGEDDGKYWIEQVLDEWRNDGKTPEEYLTAFAKQARLKPLAEVKFLKMSFLEACQRSGLFNA